MTVLHTFTIHPKTHHSLSSSPENCIDVCRFSCFIPKLCGNTIQLCETLLLRIHKQWILFHPIFFILGLLSEVTNYADIAGYFLYILCS